ncbi:MAG: MarR family transcriptional regulator, partial [Eubacterium sp.]|nr:MarR family transcriptional regulator [Eubacterium sp.]
ESLDSDRRYKKLVLTEQTLAIKDDITSRVNEYMHSMFVGIADEELKVFEKVIMQMTENTR